MRIFENMKDCFSNWSLSESNGKKYSIKYIININVNFSHYMQASVHSFWWKPFRLVEAIVFINFMVFKDQLIAISEYLRTPRVDQVY